MTYRDRSGSGTAPGPGQGREPSNREPGDSEHRDSGTVTAEFAIGMLSLAVVLAGLLSVVNVGMVKLSTQDAAMAAARALARGESLSAAERRARHVAGGSCVVTLERGSEITVATVRIQASIYIPGVADLTVTSDASVVSEQFDDTP